MRRVHLATGLALLLTAWAASARGAIADADAWFLEAEDQRPDRPNAGGVPIALDFHDADVRDVLRALAEAGGPAVTVAEDVEARVTLRFDARTWRDAFDAVVAAAGLDARQEGQLWHVRTVEGSLAANEQARRAREASEEAAVLETEVLAPRFLAAADVGRLLRGAERGGTTQAGWLSKRGSVAVDEIGNRVVVRDAAERLAAMRELMERIDAAPAQILIEAEIVEAADEATRDLGIQWGVDGAPRISGSGVGESPGGVPYSVAFPAPVDAEAGAAFDVILGSVGSGRSLDLRLTALESEGLARVVSRPRVVTLNAVPATIKSLTVIRVKLPASDTVVGGEATIDARTTATERIETGIVLVVTPRLTAERRVALDIFVKSSQADFSRVVDGIPTETSREATSQLVVADGRTVVLGGIYASRRDDRSHGVPFLRSLPVLGWLFRGEQDSDRREDLLVFLTPRILASVADPSTEEPALGSDAATESGPG